MGTSFANRTRTVWTGLARFTTWSIVPRRRVAFRPSEPPTWGRCSDGGDTWTRFYYRMVTLWLMGIPTRGVDSERLEGLGTLGKYAIHCMDCGSPHHARGWSRRTTRAGGALSLKRVSAQTRKGRASDLWEVSWARWCGVVRFGCMGERSGAPTISELCWSGLTA